MNDTFDVVGDGSRQLITPEFAPAVAGVVIAAISLILEFITLQSFASSSSSQKKVSCTTTTAMQSITFLIWNPYLSSILFQSIV